VGDRDVDQIRALRAGNPGAFSQLARDLGPRLRGLAMRFFRSPSEQEDAVQEALLQVFKAREQIDPLRADTLPGWVMTVAERRMIDLVRAASIRPQGEAALPTESAGDRTPEDDARDAELARVVGELEAKLKPAWRPYFRAVFVEGRDFDEARERLGIGRLRAKYLKKVLMMRLRGHGPLLEVLGRRRR
jgi:RNA polymerase sigma-70 factor, ECF subfamily